MWIPVLLIVGAFLYASSQSPRELTYVPPLPPSMPPGPIAVLGEFLRIGSVPPNQVILFAIAEAESLGREDLASDIIKVFVAPTVYAHEIANARPVPQPQPARPVAAPPIAKKQAPAAQNFEMSDEAIRQMLNSDPERFVQMAMGQAPPPQVIDVPVVETEPVKSPIEGVDSIDWSKFCNKISRETPLYASARHVGQYRQRKERLAELGIDPKSVLGDADAQRRALDVDLADAHQHAQASGLADDHLHRLIALPGNDDPHTVTLSGVLGVIQAAGLEGAVSWLENPADRKRYPHTTQAFVRSNGVF